MKVCILDNGITSLTLAKALVNQKIYVDIISNKNRAPTISITSKNRTAEEISNILVSNNIATRNDNFYAWRCLDALGIDTSDGVVRFSIVHYNSPQDVQNLLSTLEEI